MQWISIKNVSSWHKNFTLSLIMKSKSIEHYFMSTVKCNLWGLIVIILSQHFPSAAVKKIDTNWVKLLAPRLMTDTQQKGRKRNKKKRVATFTAMSIDAAFVFPPSFPAFFQVLLHFSFLFALLLLLKLWPTWNYFQAAASICFRPPVAPPNSQNFKLFLPRPYEKSTAAPPPFPCLPIFPPGRQGKRKICQRVVYLRAHNDSLAKEVAAVTAWGVKGLENRREQWKNRGRWWELAGLDQE